MSWTTPPTLSDGQVLTGAHTQLWRDDFNETAPAKATAAGQFFVATGANVIAARTPQAQSIATVESTTSITYTNLTTPGPAVTVTSGTACLVGVSTNMSNSTTNVNCRASFAVSGATTIAAADVVSFNWQVTGAGNTLRGSAVTLQTGLTAGSNTFTMQYRVSANTGTFDARHLWVVPF